MLIVFAVFTERAKDQSNTLSQKQAVEALAVFSFFLFVIYGLFGTMLAVFRDDIIKQGLFIVVFFHYFFSKTIFVAFISSRSVYGGP
jgi:uncharacterized membrane protein